MPPETTRGGASARLLPTERRRRLAATVEPLADRSLPWVLALPFVPVAFALVTISAVYVAAMGADPGLPPAFPNLPLGIAGVAVLFVLHRRWDRATWHAVAVFRRPSGREVGAAAVAAVAGIGIVVVVNSLATSVGVTPHDPGEVTTTFGLASLLVGSVLVAPVAEEVLFRGLVFGHLLARGWGILLAAATSVVLFGSMHVFVAGAVSVVVTGLLGAILVGLRLWYDNLVGAWLMHLLVNVWAALLAVGLLPKPW